jgi:hypothetical protein
VNQEDNFKRGVTDEDISSYEHYLYSNEDTSANLTDKDEESESENEPSTAIKNFSHLKFLYFS